MGHGLPGEPGADEGTSPWQPDGLSAVERYSRRSDQHKLDTWQGLYDALGAAASAICATHCEEEHHLSCEQVSEALEAAKP